MTDATPRGWTPPGSGRWELDREHMPGPPTPFMAPLLGGVLHDGMFAGFDRYGLPLEGLQAGIVNGHLYFRMTVVGEGKNPEASPPALPIMKMLVRLHPELRRRAKRARRALDGKLWREDARRWHEDLRPALVRRLLAGQDRDPAGLDDDALADQIDRLVALYQDGAKLHFELCSAAVSIGLLVVEGRRAGIDDAELVELLRGSSPATSAPLDAIRRVSDALLAAGGLTDTPTTVDGVRATGPEVAAALDDYLREFGWRTVGGFELDSPTLHELPDAVVSAAVGGAGLTAAPSGAAAANEVFAPCTAEQRATLIALLDEARLVYGLQDDHAGVGWHWPLGLLRRALLETGRRLAASGRIEDPKHVLVAGQAEVTTLLRDGTGPAAPALAARWTEWDRQKRLDPPAALGAEPDPPPFSVFPKAMAAVSEALFTVITLWTRTADHDDSEDLTGTGIGTDVYRGPACVARHPGEAVAIIEPGDVLVAPPHHAADNAALALAGGIVVESGGLLSHTAVMARELGIPAVVGVAGACAVVKPGELVEVDAKAGRFIVLSRAGGK